MVLDEGSRLDAHRKRPQTGELWSVYPENARSAFDSSDRSSVSDEHCRKESWEQIAHLTEDRGNPENTSLAHVLSPSCTAFLPDFGQNAPLFTPRTADWPSMSDLGEFQELITYLTRTSRLSGTEAQRVVAEVLSFLQETPEEFVRRRHRALQAEGFPNPLIYMRLAQELSAWRFRAPQYTERQIRRMIYG